MITWYASLSWSKVSMYYGPAPGAFRRFTRRHGVQWPNTCAVRLAGALEAADPNFFDGITVRLQWRGMPTQASALANLITKRFGDAELATENSLQGKKGIIFFDTIEGFAGTGHISLWNFDRVEDGGDYFEDSPRVYFWPLL